jgi:aspartate carbamoyltransferase catalytic subunit
MNLMGMNVRVIAPQTLLPADIEKFGCEVFTDLKQGLKNVDVIMCLRLQHERMTGGFLPSLNEYYHYYGISHDSLDYAKPTTMVMHPGPANRGVEISSDLIDDNAKSLVRKQVENGVFVRQAVLDLITRKKGA